MAATYINSVPSMGDATLPTNAGELIRTDEWGIDNLITDFIIQNETITETDIKDETFDQKGALVSELSYDRRWDLQLTVIGDADKAPVTGDGSSFSVGDTTFSYADHLWKLDSVAYTGTYNAKKQYVITGHRNRHFPEET